MSPHELDVLRPRKSVRLGILDNDVHLSNCPDKNIPEFFARDSNGIVWFLERSKDEEKKMNEQRTIGVGLISVGWMGKLHARAYSSVLMSIRNWASNRG